MSHAYGTSSMLFPNGLLVPVRIRHWIFVKHALANGVIICKGNAGVARQDALEMGIVAKTAAKDGKQMRSITVLTMLFLPATFVAVCLSMLFLCLCTRFTCGFHALTRRKTLFSMSVFNWDPDSPQSSLSPSVWIFFVVAIVLTGLTLGSWFFSTRQKDKHANKEEIV